MSNENFKINFTNKYYGSRKNLVDLLKLYSDYDFYENPGINEINNYTFEKKLTIIYVSNIETNLQLEKFTDIIILFEKNEIIKNYLKKNSVLLKNLIKVDELFVLNRLCEKYNLQIELVDQNKILQLSEIEGISNLLEKYMILGNIEDLIEVCIKKHVPNFETIPFLRQKFYALKNWTSDVNTEGFGKYSPDKKNFLESMINYLEYSFKATGNNTLPYYFSALCNIFN